MASRTRKSDSVTDAAEAFAPDAPATESPEVTAAPATEPDLTAFSAAATSAADAANQTTGDLDDDSAQALATAFQALDGTKARNAAKSLLKESMVAALDSDDLGRAKAFMRLGDVLVPAKAASVTKTPADPSLAIAEKIVALRAALAFAEAEVPADQSAAVSGHYADLEQGDLVGQVRALLAHEADTSEDKGDAPESAPVVRAAARLVRSKVPGARKASTGGSSYSGVRRDVAAHVRNAFADKQSGDFLTVSEIVNVKSAEYGDEVPSAGAVSARLFPSGGRACNVEGVVPATDEKGRKGATKA